MKTTRFRLLILLTVISVQLHAQNQKRDLQKEIKIEKQLEAVDGTLVKTFKDATIAMDENKLELADSMYSIIYAKVPTFDPAIRRLGMIRFNLGNHKEGARLCKKAVMINKSAYNLLSLAYIYFYSQDSTKYSEAFSILKQAQQLPDGNDVDILTMLIQLSLQLGYIEDFRTITTILKEKHPDQMLTHYYSAILSTYNKEWINAKNEILKAQEMGLPKEYVDGVLKSGVNIEVMKINIAIYLSIIVGTWILGLLLLYLVGKLFSGLTLRSIEKNTLNTSSAKPGGWLRSGYKLLINAGGIYYYLSLPVIIILVLTLVAGLIYVFLMVGSIPVQLMFLAIVGSAVTIYSMVRSLLVKVDYTDPGRELKVDEAPGLFRLTNEVAQLMETRPIDEIRITPQTDLAVYETGTWKDKLNDKGKRYLILGTGVLNDFRISDFKAVLAHEYGHFTHRDTAGGEVALRVQNDMNKYFFALYQANQNTVWNVAFHFLRLYNFIFRRISHGATRLQEVLADRVAAQTFGTPAFVQGLTHVIKRGIAFNKYANYEIKEAINSKRLINNLYQLPATAEVSVDEELYKLLNQKTMEDDTHPSPVDRFRYIAGFNSVSVSGDQSFVKDLFTDWNVLTEEMTKKIEVNIDRDEY